MGQDHAGAVTAQFGPQARAYVESAVHAGGADLEALGAILAAEPPARALDLGTGGGHVAYLMARHAAGVVAAPLTGAGTRSRSARPRRRR